MGKDLMSQDELAVMDNSKCILQLRGERPFLSEKYDITRHPNYRFLSDTDSKLAFIFRKEVDKNMKLETDRVSEIYNVGFVSSDA